MDLLIKIAAIIGTVGILVTIHELGHYWAARWCDVKILRFSIGLGPPLWSIFRGRDNTEWAITAFPIGGYVKMADEREESVAPADRARAFNSKSVWQRMFIVAAGPIANFLLAICFYWVLLMAGIPGTKPYLAAPAPGSTAAAAGFGELDLLTRVGGREVRTWADARLALLEAAVARATVDIEIEDAGGGRYGRQLNLSGISKDDLDRDFLGKVGINPYRLGALPIVDEVTGDSPAARAGLRAGDRFISVDDQPVAKWEQLTQVVAAKPGQALRIGIVRGGVEAVLTITPERINENGRSFGRIGVRPQVDRGLAEKLRIVVRSGPIESIIPAVGKVWDMSVFSLRMMGRMLTGDVSWKNLSGPVTIADYAGQSAMMGWVQYVNFLALISISLGVLNLLPIPVLDGGQLMYYMAEILKGSPVSERVMQIGQQVGLALLLGLTAFAFYNDIHRLLTG